MAEASSSQLKLAPLTVPKAVSFATAPSDAAPAPVGSASTLPVKVRWFHLVSLSSSAARHSFKGDVAAHLPVPNKGAPTTYAHTLHPTCERAVRAVQSKALAVRKWLAVNAEGEALHLELAKLRVTHYLGVQLRDLR